MNVEIVSRNRFTRCAVKCVGTHPPAELVRIERTVVDEADGRILSFDSDPLWNMLWNMKVMIEATDRVRRRMETLMPALDRRSSW